MKNSFVTILVLIISVSCLKDDSLIQKETIPMGAYSIDLDKDGKNEVVVSFFDEVNEKRERLKFFKVSNKSLTEIPRETAPINHLRNIYNKEDEFVFLDHGTENRSQINGGMKYLYNYSQDLWKIDSREKLFFFDGDFIKFKNNTFEVVVGLNFVELKVNQKKISSPDIKGGYISSEFFLSEGGVSLILGPSDTNSMNENKIVILTLYLENKQWKYKKREIPLKSTPYGVVEIIPHYIDDDEEWDFFLVLHDRGFNSAEIGKLESKNQYLYKAIYTSKFFENAGMKNYWLSQWRWKRVGDKKHFYFRIHPGSSKTEQQACGIGKIENNVLSISKDCMLGFFDESPSKKMADFYISNELEIKKIGDLNFSNN